ncbi:MAG: hypothetical protein ACXWVM_00720 [Polyangiales bacterium]
MLAILSFASVVATQDAVDPRPDDDRHGWAEARLGAGGLSSFDDSQMRFGPSIAGAFGTGFKWLDLGVAGRYASVAGPADRLTTFAVGPEVALRKRLGTGATLRLGLTPQYVFAWGLDSHARYGAEGTAQLFFTLEESTATFLRAGLGLRAGRWASVEKSDPAGWSVGVDLIVRTFW